MGKSIKNEGLDALFDAILKLQTIEECYDFFEDLCTIKELKDMSQRVEVANMLRDKKKYQDIADKTGASTATISRVNRTLTYGNDGYNKILDRVEEKNKRGV